MKRARQLSISFSREQHDDRGIERRSNSPMHQHQPKQCKQSHCSPRSCKRHPRGYEHLITRIFATGQTRRQQSRERTTSARRQRSLFLPSHLLWLVGAILGTSLPLLSAPAGATGAIGGSDRASLDFVVAGSAHALRGLIVMGRAADEADAGVGTVEGKGQGTGAAGDGVESYVVVDGASQVGYMGVICGDDTIVKQYFCPVARVVVAVSDAGEQTETYLGVTSLRNNKIINRSPYPNKRAAKPTFRNPSRSRLMTVSFGALCLGTSAAVLPANPNAKK